MSAIKKKLINLIYQTQITASTPISSPIAIGLMLISSIQLIFLSILGNSIIPKFTIDSLNITLQQISEFVLVISEYQMHNLKSWEVFLIIILLCYMLILLGIIILTIFSIHKSRALPLFFRKYTYFINIFHIMILFMPCQNIILGVFFRILYNLDTLKSSIIIVGMIFSLLAFLINISFALFINAYTINLKTKDKFSRLSRYGLLAPTLQKLFLGIIYSFSIVNEKNRNYSWFFNIILTLLNLYMCYKFIVIPPFFSKKLTKIMRNTYSIMLIASLWNIITLLANQERDVITSGIFVTIVMMISPFFSHWFGIVMKNQNQARSIDLNSQTHLIQWIKLIVSTKKIFSNSGLTTKGKRILKKEFEDVISIRIHTSSIQITNRADLKEYLFSINNSMKKVPPLANLFIAEILVNDCASLSQGYFICNKVMNSEKLSYGEHLTALALQNSIQEKIKFLQERNEGFSALLSSILNIQTLLELSKQAVNSRDKLYSALISTEVPSIVQMSELSKNIQEAENAVNDYWIYITKNSQEYPPLIKIYGLFKTYVELKREQGHQYLMRYKSILTKKQQHNIVSNRTSDKTAFVSVGAEPNNLGKILQIYNSQQIFGKPSTEYMNKKINLLMTASLSSVHDSMMRHKLENSERMSTLQKYNVLARHDHGHILPIRLSVVINPNISEGLKFLGLVRAITSNLEYMILDQQGFVEGMSKRLKESIVFTVNQDTHISDFATLYEKINVRKPSFDFTRLTPLTSSKADNGLYANSDEKLENNDDNRRNFVHLLDEQIALKIDILLSIQPDRRRKDKVIKFICNVSCKEYMGRKTYEFYMNKIFQSSNRLGLKTPRASSNTQGLFALTVARLSSKDKFFEQDEETDSQNVGEDNYTNHHNDMNSSKDNSENMDLYKESAYSRSILREENEIQHAIDVITKSTSYYNFYSSYLMLAFLAGFSILFFMNILSTYLYSSQLLHKTELRMQAISYDNARGRDIALTFFSLYPLYVFTDILFLYNHPFAQGSLFQLYTYFQNIIVQNKLLERKASELGPEELEFFFGENLKMYTQNFESIPDATYQKVNQFTLVHSLFSQAMYYFNRYIDFNSESRAYALDFLFGNVMNDLWISTLNAPEVLSKAMSLDIENTTDYSHNFFIASLVSISFLLILILILFPKYYYETTSFMDNIINAGDSIKCIEVVQKDLQTYRDFLDDKPSQGMKKEKAKDKEKAKEKLKNKANSGFKNGKRQEYFFKMVARALLMVIIFILPIFMIFNCYDNFQESTSMIMPVIRDIKNLNNITYNAIPIQSYIGILFSRPETKIINKNISEIIDQAFVDYRDCVSVSKQFSPQTLQFLNTEYCSYFVPNEIYPDCKVLFKGMGMRGIMSTISEGYTFHSEYYARLKSTVWTPQAIMYYAFYPENLELVMLTSYGSSIAIQEFQNKLIVELIDKLNSSTTEFLIYFIFAGLSIILILVMSYMVVYRAIYQERKWNSGCLNVLPMDFICKNKHLRIYLLNESKVFHKILKKHSSLYSTGENES